MTETKKFPTTVVMSLASGYGHLGVTHKQRQELYEFLTGKELADSRWVESFDRADIAAEVIAILKGQLPTSLCGLICREYVGDKTDHGMNQLLNAYPPVLSLRGYELPKHVPSAAAVQYSFKALPADVDFGRILCEAPADARIVWVEAAGVRFCFMRLSAWDELARLKLFPISWRPIGQWLPSLRRDRGDVFWGISSKPLHDWRLGVMTSDTGFSLSDAKELLAKLDAALAKEKAEKDKIEVKVEAF